MDELVVPDLVVQRASSGGVVGRRWLDTLPEVVATLVDRWGLELGAAFSGGSSAFVVAATPRLVRDRARLLADRCDVDPQTVWEWGFIERVSTGLANRRDFDNDDGEEFLEVARRCL